MVTADEVRSLALSLPGAEEHEHWGKPSFRVRNKIFAVNFVICLYWHGNLYLPKIWLKLTMDHYREAGKSIREGKSWTVI